MHLQHNVILINESFHYELFHKLLNFFLFQCNEHLEMNKFLCSLACTWMTIIDSLLYIFRCFNGIKCSIGGCLDVL